MKTITQLLTLFLMLAFITPVMSAEAVKTKKICKDVKDKDGKIKQTCKTIKLHKKVQGTKVPEKASKK